MLFAGDLGIYGNCVVLDHGLGLASLYGHLSRIDVEAGAKVEADQRLGLTGATGLAGGDHLHFAMLVGNVYVDPIEWWDAKWVADHVDAEPESAARSRSCTPRALRGAARGACSRGIARTGATCPGGARAIRTRSGSRRRCSSRRASRR